MSGIPGITEAEIAGFLVRTPEFFERHAEILAAARLTSPHGQRAVSLQERQMEMLRDKIKGLEHRIIEMIRASQDNEAIGERLHRFTRAILLTANAADLPEVIVREIRHEFMVPRAALRIWGAADPFAALRFAQGASDDVRTFAASLRMPYCGVNSGFEACLGGVAGHDLAAPRRRGRCLRPAGARLARPHALQRRYGH